jgi:hypothetical protein
MSQAKNAASATPTDVSKDEISLLRTLKELGVPPSRLTKLLSPKEETAPVKGEEFDLVEVYHRAYSKALAIALERQALRDAGLLTNEQERPHNNSTNGLDAIVEALKSRPQSEKLSVSDLTMLILASNLGGGANKSEGGISLRDLLPLLQKGGQLSVSDVVALLERAKPPPSPAMPAGNSGGLNDIFDESIKTVLRDKIVKALTEESKKGSPTDWGQVANHVIEAIRGLTARIPPPPESPAGEPILPASESPPPPAEAASGSESPTPLGSEPTAAETTLSSSGTAIPKSLPSEFEEGSGA